MTDWYQQALTPPAVLEFNARLGVIPEQDHLQALVEVKDPTTGVLIGQWSYPHARLAAMDEVVAWLAAKLLEALRQECEPF